MASVGTIMMPLRVHGVPFASHSKTTGHAGVGPGTTPSSSMLDFTVSGAGDRLEGLMVANLAASAAAASSAASAGSDTQRGSQGGEREEGARDGISTADERAGFVVKEGLNPVRDVPRHSLLQ